MPELKDLIRLRTKLYNEMVENERQAIAYQQKATILREKLQHVIRAIQNNPSFIPSHKIFTLSTGEKISVSKKQEEKLLQSKASSLVDAMLARMNNGNTD